MPQVAVAMLHFYEDRILQCHSMEVISEFLKDEMPQLVLDNMLTILGEALRMDLGNELLSYETEYFVLEELTESLQLDTDAEDLKSLNESLKSFNKELIDQLALCRGLINNLESKVASLEERLKERDQRIERLVCCGMYMYVCMYVCMYSCIYCQPFLIINFILLFYDAYVSSVSIYRVIVKY